MTNSVQSIPLGYLVAHPDNANEMSEVNFGKLVRNIKGSGLYEPLIVRPSREVKGGFQIINGEHRYRALRKLGYESADCIVWDVDDEQTDILLATLNRLCGSEKLSKKLELLKRLRRRMETQELAKLLPQSAKQIERLVNLQRPIGPAKIDTSSFANPLVFFVDDQQKKIIEEALSHADGSRPLEGRDEKGCGNARVGTKASKRAAALVNMAEYFLDDLKTHSRI